MRAALPHRKVLQIRAISPAAAQAVRVRLMGSNAGSRDSHKESQCWRHYPGADNLGRLNGFVRVHVHGLHEPARRLPADAQHRDADPGVSGADRDEERAVGAVPGVIDPQATRHGKGKAAPQGRAVVEQAPAAPAVRRHERHLQLAHPDRLTPVQPGTSVRHSPGPGGFNRVERRFAGS